MSKKSVKKSSLAVNTAAPVSPPDIVKARAELDLARKAFDEINRKHSKALLRLSDAQANVDAAVAGIKNGAPAGSKWGPTICTISGVDFAGVGDTFSLSGCHDPRK